MKNIKTKEKVQNIKTVDKKNNHHFEKQINFNEKKQNTEKNHQENDGQHYAINKIVDKEKNITIESKHRVYKGIKHRKQKRENRNSISINIDVKQSYKHKNRIKNRKNINDQPYVNNMKEMDKKIKIKKQNLKKDNQFKSRGKKKINHYHLKMKEIAIDRYKKRKLKKSSQKTIQKSTNGAVTLSKNVYKITKIIVKGVPKLVSMGTGLLLLCTISLFIGVFGALSYDTRVDSSTMNLPQEVIEYRMIIEQYAKKYNIEEYVPLVQAVMMQESGGRGNDPMQASECSYNKKYPKNIMV